MGKGGTKFDGDAISSRKSRTAGLPSGKDRRKAMEKFLETGMHPEVERAWREEQLALHPLPAIDVHRAFVFLDISIANKPQGRLVIELFDDIVPVAANHFRNRCLPGSSTGLTGASFHKLIPHYAIFGGHHARAGEGITVKQDSTLKAMEAGTVSVSLDGKEFAIALGKSLKLDSTHQVIGRINMGKEVLDVINDLSITPDDTPVYRVTVTKAGACNHKGVHEELDPAAAAAAGKDLATRLKEASEEARSSVLDALQVGLGQKRKPEGNAAAAATSGGEAAGASGSGLAAKPAQQAAPAAAAPARNVKAKMLDAMLGDISSSEEDSDS